ncbi:GFA family protein [Kordiimonas lipolytica]|uniref:GFA family protein n=1 Tax=Kordiimonas lipolytica TaxID=1662421 RepID=A0ABV8UCJ1_9PROT|nr:aldehyde-activating protein [Kordiimonas lipolytica]
MIKGSCHCGAVRFEFPGSPEWLTECNCSLCRRLGARWAYADEANVTLHMASGATESYIQGDRTLATHRCRTCGCVTHWEALDKSESSRMGVNMRLADPADVAGIRVRHLDGADSWQYLD